MSADQLTALQNTLLTALKESSTKIHEKIDQLQNTLKTEIDTVKAELTTHSSRLDKVESDLENANSSTQIAELTLQVELLKQDKLRNNIRITGLPQTAFDDPDEAILRIAAILNIDIIPSDFIVYGDRHKSSLIVSFHSYVQKRILMDAMKKKQSLFVEEIYESIQSNSRIYCNDQLSPYFASIFQLAWHAKKEGSIFSASSIGGRIRVKKHENSTPRTIQTETELTKYIAEQMETESQQNVMSQHSHDKTANNKDTSPQSVDSATARLIRDKPFTHQRQNNNYRIAGNQQASNRSQQASNRSQQKPASTNGNQHSNPNIHRESTKRNSRHVSSLDHRSQQPFNKKNRYTTNHNSTPDPGTSDFRYYRRNYRDRLRSFTK